MEFLTVDFSHFSAKLWKFGFRVAGCVEIWHLFACLQILTLIRISMKLSRKKQHAKKNLKNKLNPVRFAIWSQKAFMVIFIFKKEVVWTKQNIFPLHYIKSVQIQFFLFDSRKIRNRKNSVFGHFSYSSISQKSRNLGKWKTEYFAKIINCRK